MRNQANGPIQIGGYQLRIDSILGKGATGNVYKGTRTADGVSVAIKAIDMVNVNNEVTQYLLEGEKRALTEIKHPYVIKCEDIIQNKDFCYIVMEECTGGTLRDLIKNKGPLPQAQAIKLFRKIVHGYCKVIDSKIIHRDLKTANIMLKSNKDPVIIDFGYCQMIMGKRPLIKYNVGSPTYMSPQAYQNSRYSEKSDVWALGIILHEMITGKTLDQGCDIKFYFQSIKKKKMVNFNIPNSSELIRKLLQSALVFSPEERASSHRLKYLIDVSVGGPLMNPEGMSIKLQQKCYGIQTPFRTIYHRQNYRETLYSDANIRPFNESRTKYTQQRKSSLNLNDAYFYSPTLEYNKTSNNVVQPTVTFLDLTNYSSKNRSIKTELNRERKVYFTNTPTNQQIVNHQTQHTNHHIYGIQFKRLH